MEKKGLAGIWGETDKDRGTQLKRRGTKETTAAKGNILYRQPCLFLDQPIAKLKKKEKKAEAWG